MIFLQEIEGLQMHSEVNRKFLIVHRVFLVSSVKLVSFLKVFLGQIDSGLDHSFFKGRERDQAGSGVVLIGDKAKDLFPFVRKFKFQGFFEFCKT